MKYIGFLFINFLCCFHSLFAEDAPQAEFLVEISRNQVYACECYVATASFLISQENKVYLQFMDLGLQVNAIRKALAPEDAWVHYTNITDVKSNYIQIKGQNYHQYKIVEAGICPTQAGEFKIPALDFIVAKTDKERTFQDSLLFQSEAHTITVHPVPVSGLDSLYANDYYQMVGEFKIEEDFEHIRKIFPTGDTINYTFTIVGRGNTFPIGLNLYPKKGVEILLKSTHIEDTIMFNKLRAKKTFHLQIVSWVKDTLHLGNHVQWHYFSPREQKVKVVKPEAWFFTWLKSSTQPTEHAPSKNNHDLVVILDISESMYIEDYGTDRISKGIELVNSILLKHTMHKEEKESPLVVFAGKATTLYVDQISFSIMRYGKPRGTSIGNAIWEAKELLKKSDAPQKKIILICDGDNTSGSLSETMAARIAKTYGITINCIGLGYEGIVPFGFDLLGQRRYVDNSYQDTSLKKVAEITGGKFLHLERENHIDDIVHAILD